jgi:hypothetical protein
MNGTAGSSRTSPSPRKAEDIPLETEPLVFFHPNLVGTANPGKVQPVQGSVLLEEEPATWPQMVV